MSGPDDLLFTRGEPRVFVGDRDAVGRVYIDIEVDTRGLTRKLERHGAVIDDAKRPNRAADIRRLMARETVVRKALGEFD